ncbi:MAG: NAD-dependent epimerase/dehydratase [Acidimicrobiales bacterium]|nr:NAD-dependent epimerase/dehydratase [Acidimicrobiales bacterium]
MSTHTLITGGAGFIGTNMAHRLLQDGERVVVLDDLSRPGVSRNVRWLVRTHPRRLRIEVADVRDRTALRTALTGAARVFHLAAQVAVTTSLVDPVHDFASNLDGTIGVLEELRRLADPPPLLFTSTNKVYGGLDDVLLERRGERYEPADLALRDSGVGEGRPLQFCSPYGCSKGGADQYVLDYARSFGLRTAVFRMSCIYGPHQCGTEDQGWVAHFLVQAMRGRPITLYGDGRQVRDLLFVEDLLRAMRAATTGSHDLYGQAFNMGGGPLNALSLLELLDLIEDLEGRRPRVNVGRWRVGDQRWYVSDTSRFGALTGWAPRVGVVEGTARLHAWLRQDRTPAPAVVS